MPSVGIILVILQGWPLDSWLAFVMLVCMVTGIGVSINHMFQPGTTIYWNL